MNLHTVLVAGVLLVLLLIAGRLARAYIAPFQWLLLPASVIGGTLGLLAGPQGVADVLPHDVHGVWRDAPEVIISIVFATLFLGKPIPGPRRIWEMAAPQATFGQTVAWGQYVIGLTLGILILTPFFGMDPMVGALIEIGFEGGHGTAAGLTSTFNELEFPDGRDLAMGLATIGVVLAIVIGSLIIKWKGGDRENVEHDGRHQDDERDETKGGKEDADADNDPDGADAQGESDSEDERSILDPLSLQLGMVGIAIGLGWLIQQGLILLENATWGGEDGLELLAHLPLFPMAMIGGVIVQLIADATGLGHFLRGDLMSRIRGAALDLTIAAAIASLSIDVLTKHWQVLLILAAAGVTWNVAALLLLAPRIIHRATYERGIGDFGQSMGMTVTGLLLMRMIDPSDRTGAVESFGYKQMFFEPFVGGGIITAMSLPLIHTAGPVFALAAAALVLAAWLTFAWFKFMRHDKTDKTDGKQDRGE